MATSAPKMSNMLLLLSAAGSLVLGVSIDTSVGSPGGGPNSSADVPEVCDRPLSLSVSVCTSSPFSRLKSLEICDSRRCAALAAFSSRSLCFSARLSSFSFNIRALSFFASFIFRSRCFNSSFFLTNSAALFSSSFFAAASRRRCIIDPKRLNIPGSALSNMISVPS